MTETLKQIRDYISDGRFIDAMTLLDEVMTDCQQLVTKCNELEKKLEIATEIIDCLEKQNSELKKLFLRCKDYLSEWITPMDILAEIDELDEK